MISNQIYYPAGCVVQGQTLAQGAVLAPKKFRDIHGITRMSAVFERWDAEKIGTETGARPYRQVDLEPGHHALGTEDVVDAGGLVRRPVDERPLEVQEPEEGYQATGWEIVDGGDVWTKRPTGVEPLPEPEPVQRTLLLPMEFTDRFTTDEKRGLDAAAATDNDIYEVRWAIRQASEIDLTSPQTVGGVNALVAAGVLTQARAAEVLAPAETPL